MNEELRAALQQARKLEIDGADYYGELAEKCSVESGRKMFHSFAQDEKRHLRIIEDVAKGMGVDVDKFSMPRDRIRTLFSDKKQELEKASEVSSDEREAVETALEMERKSYQLYRDSAEKAGDEETRTLFERLAREENQHYEMLENTLEYLNSNEQWFLWKEWALIVGDQSSLGIE